MIGNVAEVDGLAVEVAASEDGRGWRIAVLVGVISLIWAATFGPEAWRSAKKTLQTTFRSASWRGCKQKADDDDGWSSVSKQHSS
jgi:hypothetical protein